MKPRVSVLMPAFNAEEFIGQAIDSVLSQSYSDFELVVVNDGSTDSTRRIVLDYADNRIRLIDKPTNEGLAAARNLALYAAKGHYVAWLDADDVAHPRRLGLQVSTLDRMPEVGLCGSWVKTMGMEPQRTWRYPRRSKYIRAHMLFDDPLATSAVTMVKDLALDNGIVFDEEYAPAEDYDYWEQLSRLSDVINIPRVLSFHRLHPGQTSTRDAHRIADAVRRIQERQFERLRISLGDTDWAVHELIGLQWGARVGHSQIAAAMNWLSRIEEANEVGNVYDKRAMRRVIKRKRNMLRLKEKPSVVRRLRLIAGASLQ